MDAVTKLFGPGYTIGDESYRQVDRFCSPYGKRVLLIGGETGMLKGLPVLCEALKAADSDWKLWMRPYTEQNVLMKESVN